MAALVAAPDLEGTGREGPSSEERVRKNGLRYKGSFMGVEYTLEVYTRHSLTRPNNLTKLDTQNPPEEEEQ